MKKLLSLMLLCMVCMGAWAQNAATVITNKESATNYRLTIADLKALIGTNGHFSFHTTQRSDWSTFKVSDTNVYNLTPDQLHSLQQSGSDENAVWILNYAGETITNIGNGQQATYTANATTGFDLFIVDCGSTPHSDFGNKQFRLDNSSGNHLRIHSNDFTTATGDWTRYVAYGPFYVIKVICKDANGNEIQTSNIIVSEGSYDVTAPSISGKTSTQSPIHFDNVNEDKVVEFTYTEYNPGRELEGKSVTLKNRQHNFYVGYRTSDNAIEGSLSMNNTTAWQVVASDDKFVLKNGDKFMGAVPTTHDTHNYLVESIEDAEKFTFAKVDDFYTLQLSSVCSSCSSAHNYLHGVHWTGQSMTDRGVEYTTVRWASNSEASQWTIEEIQVAPLQAKVDAAMAAIYADKVGYPDRNNDTNTDAITELSQYQTIFAENPPINNTNYAAALAALNAVYDLTSINLPQDGKMYFLVNIAADNSKHIIYESSSQDKIQWTNITDQIYTQQQAKGLYICRKVDDRFVFVNAATGHYLIWRGSTEGSNNKKGYRDAFENDCKLAVKRAEYSNQSGATSQGDLFGYVCIEGTREGYGDNICFLYSTASGNSSNFNQDSSETMLYESGNSAMFALEEISNPNLIKLTKPESSFEGGLNQKFVGTFSAPYNVELPKNVKAYTATLEGSIIKFNLLNEGNLVPKNTGVLVYAESATEDIKESAVPAAISSENMPTVAAGENLLVGTNGTGASVSTDVNAYILASTTEEGVLFYKLSLENAISRIVNRNKAYLVLPTGSSASAFRFDFEEQTTGIKSVESIVPAQSAFDLSGRSVNANQRGIYIVEGKKVIR